MKTNIDGVLVVEGVSDVAFLSSLIVTIVLYGLLNQYFPKPFTYLIILCTPLIINIVSISNYCLEKYRNKDKLK